MLFDARTAKQLKAGDHIMVDGCPGLRLMASTSRRTWTYRYKSPVDGRMRQIKIGHWPAMAPAAAAGAWEKLRDQRDEGSDPAQIARVSRAPAKPNPTERDVRALVADYLSGHVRRHRKPKGAAEVERLFERYLGSLADRAAASITRADAFALLESRAGTPVQTAQLRRELGAAWDYALDSGRLPAESPNWWRLVMRGRLRSKGKKLGGKNVGTAKRALKEAEVSTLIPWLPNFSRAVCDVLTLYLWTGTRGAEIVAMEASEISQEADGLWWTVPKAKTKNERHDEATDLRVPLIGRAADIVRRRRENADRYLFPSRSKSGHIEQKAISFTTYFHQPYSTITPHVNRLRLPVTHWTPHDLRRTARTFLASMECPNEVAEAILGHMQPGVQGTYNLHDYDRERRAWLTRLDEKLEALTQTL